MSGARDPGPAASAVQSAFSIPVRVYWEDTDAGGVVYHASYLRFFERARTEWLRALGLVQSTLRETDDLVFVVRDLRIGFVRPARLDDALLATVDAVRTGGASLRFAQRLLRADDGTLLVEAEVRAACVRASTLRPMPVPAALAARFATGVDDAGR